MWILFIFVAGSGTTVSSAEFSTKASCISASTEVLNSFKSDFTTFKTVCVKK